MEESEEQANVNVYGSIIAEGSVLEEIAIDATEHEGNLVSIACSCKGQCIRAKGRGVCICKARSQFCDPQQCSCKQEKCKNKPRDENVAGGIGRQREPDGDVRFQNDLQVSITQIQEFVASLESEQKDELLTNLLAMGRGSLDFATNLLNSHNSAIPEPNTPAPEWCKCKHCRTMENEAENNCCKRVSCITLRRSFSNICLDRENLEVCIKERCDYRADEFDFSMESFRKAGYRRYILWSYGKLGRGNRRVIPSCVVWAIRDCYKSANGQYMGYRNI